MIKHFQTPANHCWGVYLTQGRQGILGVVYGSKSQEPPIDYYLSLALINMQNQICESIVTFSNKGLRNNAM
jgi:hypothetical protein